MAYDSAIADRVTEMIAFNPRAKASKKRSK